MHNFGQNWPFQFFPNLFAQNGFKKIWNPQFCQNWPFQNLKNHFGAKDWKKFRMTKIGCSKFFQTILVQKGWKKFGMANFGQNGHSEFF